MPEQKGFTGNAVQEATAANEDGAEEGEQTKGQTVSESGVSNNEATPSSVPARTSTPDPAATPEPANPRPPLWLLAVSAIVVPFVLYFLVVGPLTVLTETEISGVLRVIGPLVGAVVAIAQRNPAPSIAITIIMAITIMIVALVVKGHDTLDKAIETVGETLKHVIDAFKGDRK